jgi:hypothetical protein
MSSSSLYDEFAIPPASVYTPAAHTAEQQGRYVMPPEYVTAIDPDGRLVAIPVAQTAPEAPPAPAAALEPAPTTETAPPPRTGLSPAIVQGTLLGCGVAITVATATYLVLEGLHAAGPYLDEAGHALMWLAAAIGTIVVLLLTAKVRSNTNGRASISLYHREQTTTIDKQTARGRNAQIHNH